MSQASASLSPICAILYFVCMCFVVPQEESLILLKKVWKKNKPTKTRLVYAFICCPVIAAVKSKSLQLFWCKLFCFIFNLQVSFWLYGLFYYVGQIKCLEKKRLCGLFEFFWEIFGVDFRVDMQVEWKKMTTNAPTSADACLSIVHSLMCHRQV